MASQFHSGGRKSSISLINVLSSQNATSRDDNGPSSRWAKDSSSQELLQKESDPTELPNTPEAQRARARAEFHSGLASRVVSRSVSLHDVEKELSEYPAPDADEMLVLLSPAGLVLQQTIDTAVIQMAQVFPQAMSQGSSLAFKAAMVPLYDAQRHKRSAEVRSIAQKMVEQFAQDNFPALAWIKTLAKL